MLIRRVLRIKIMQFIYSYYLSELNSEYIKKKLLYNINELYCLYIDILNIIISMRYLAKKKINYINSNNFKYFNSNLEYKNSIILNKLLYLVKNKFLKKLSKNYKILSCKDVINKEDNYNDVIIFLLNNFISCSYDDACYSSNINFDADKKLIINFYKKFIQNNNKIAILFQDKYITWLEDIKIAYRMVYNTLLNLQYDSSLDFKLFKIFKDKTDECFVLDLYKNTILNKSKIDFIISRYLDNWSLHRIALIDRVILHMAISEFLYIPDIPFKVTLNEYIEISKIYSTDKSKIFINGILDVLFKNFKNDKKI